MTFEYHQFRDSTLKNVNPIHFQIYYRQMILRTTDSKANLTLYNKVFVTKKHHPRLK